MKYKGTCCMNRKNDNHISIMSKDEMKKMRKASKITNIVLISLLIMTLICTIVVYATNLYDMSLNHFIILIAYTAIILFFIIKDSL